MRRSVALADDDVGVQLRGILVKHKITGQREHFHLLRYRNPPILFAFPVEIAERQFLKSANRREVRGAQSLLFGELCSAGGYFVAGIEDDHERLFAGVVEQFGFHLVFLRELDFARLTPHAAAAPSIRAPPISHAGRLFGFGRKGWPASW